MNVKVIEYTMSATMLAYGFRAFSVGHIVVRKPII